MPRSFVAILLLISLCYQLVVKLGIVAYYQYNKSYIAANLCENKNKPELKCCGKCYLRKQLKKADDPAPQSKNLPSKQTQGEQIVFIVPQSFHIGLSAPAAAIVHIAYPQQFSTYAPLCSIFQPPGLLA